MHINPKDPVIARFNEQPVVIVIARLHINQLTDWYVSILEKARLFTIYLKVR